MENELRERAEKKVKAKLAFYYCAIIFTAVSVVLLMLSFYLPGAAIWLRLPIPVFAMVLGLVYLSAYGLPTANGHSEDWEEEEIQKEMIKLRRRQKVELPPQQDLSKSDQLELKELERLQEKWDVGEDYV